MTFFGKFSDHMRGCKPRNLSSKSVNILGHAAVVIWHILTQDLRLDDMYIDWDHSGHHIFLTNSYQGSAPDWHVYRLGSQWPRSGMDKHELFIHYALFNIVIES